MRHLFAFASLAVLAGCVAPSSPPPAPPRPVPTPAPAGPAPAPPPVASSDWRDWPVTPGNWTYRREGQGATAVYGSAAGATIFAIRCDPAARQIVLGGATASVPMTVRTTSTERRIGSNALPANDPLIDAMGYSRGRFIVETPGAAPLVLPAWPEVLRVAEDCRR